MLLCSAQRDYTGAEMMYQESLDLALADDADWSKTVPILNRLASVMQELVSAFGRCL